jgi:hypothetical protein
LTEAAERWQSERCPFASAEQPFGRFFSLDGIHPTLDGATVLANALLEDLEELFGVQLPLYPEEGCAGTAPFSVTAAWTTAGGDTGIGHPVAVSRDTVYFWFFDPRNVELLVKVLDGCVINGRHWVFAAGLTDVGVELTVTDTRDGSLRTYTHASGTPLAPVQDTSAFDLCP